MGEHLAPVVGLGFEGVAFAGHEQFAGDRWGAGVTFLHVGEPFPGGPSPHDGVVLFEVVNPVGVGDNALAVVVFGAVEAVEGAAAVKVAVGDGGHGYI